MGEERSWDAVRSVLLPGEQVHWVGRPKPLSQQWGWIVWAGFLLTWALGSVLVFFLVRSRVTAADLDMWLAPDGQRQGWREAVLVLGSAATLLVWLVVLSLPGYVSRWRNTTYAVTDQRALIIVKGSVDSRLLHEASPTRIVGAPFGVATLCIGRDSFIETSRGNAHRRQHGFSFENLDGDAERVEQLLHTLSSRVGQAHAAHGAAAPPGTVSGASAAPSMTDDEPWNTFWQHTLAREERVLWTGWPQSAQTPELRRFAAVFPITVIAVSLLVWRASGSILALLVAAVIVVLVLLGVRGSTARLRGDTLYAVTDRRVLIADQTGTRSKPLEGASPRVTGRNGEGVGTLLFDWAYFQHPTRDEAGGWFSWRPRFEFVNIPDAVGVAALVRDASAAFMSRPQA